MFFFSIVSPLRLRTRKENGELVRLSSAHGKDRLALGLRRGKLCLTLRLHPQMPSLLCLNKVPVNDGKWHKVMVVRLVRFF